MKRVPACALLLLSTAALAADEPLAGRTIWPCVESVVIAHIEKVGELVDYDTGEDEIILHPRSYVDIGIERVLFGVTPPASLTIVHLPEIQDGAGMFLLGRRDGKWINLGFEPHVAVDRKGRYVVPFLFEPPEDYLAPQGWIPRDYRDHLRRIRYDPKAAAWMHEGKYAESGWSHLQGAYAVANRGLVLDDIGDLLAQTLAEPCIRNAP
jgi:hypothetical protein